MNDKYNFFFHRHIKLFGLRLGEGAQKERAMELEEKKCKNNFLFLFQVDGVHSVQKCSHKMMRTWKIFNDLSEDHPTSFGPIPSIKHQLAAIYSERPREIYFKTRKLMFYLCAIFCFTTFYFIANSTSYSIELLLQHIFFFLF